MQHFKTNLKGKTKINTFDSSALWLFVTWTFFPAWVSNTVLLLPLTSSTDTLEMEGGVLVILFILPIEDDKDFVLFLSSRLKVWKKKERKLIEVQKQINMQHKNDYFF